METNFYLIVMLHCVAIALSQRVAPGVPPQHYQPNGQHPSQQQQQHIQQHQVPVQPQQQQYQQQQQYAQQQQHMPQQQQHIPQQQVPMQQQPPPQHQQHQQQHHGGHQQGHQNPQILNPGNIAHEKEHIAEHMDVPIDTSKMSEQELQFHYFKMHDADNNNKLDGCELIKSLIHWHEEGSKHKHQESTPTETNQVGDKIFSDEELVGLIDPILNMDDGNKDGYIDYPEFVRAQQKAQVQQQQQGGNH